MNGSDTFSAPSLLKQRKNDSSKRDFGTLVCVCGSASYRGAASLAVSAALRSGVGICCLASTEKVIAAASAKISECTFLPLCENENGAICSSGAYGVIERSAKATAVLIGPGLSLDPDTKKLVYEIVNGTSLPLVLDADALNALSENRTVLENAGGRCVITPHFGEAARLLGVSYAEIASAPERHAKALSERFGCVAVLKSHKTYIARKDEIFVNDAPNSGLAKGGSGDVLSGIIAGLVSQGYGLCEAARLGVYIHSKAGEKAAESKTAYAVLPSDTVSFIPEVFSELIER